MTTLSENTPRLPGKHFRKILGITFFAGEAVEAVDRMSTSMGGLLVVPAAPALKDIPWNLGYREALLNADLTITDSAFMVLIWNIVQHDRIQRLSGLAYLRELLKRQDVRKPGNTFWVMPNASSANRNTDWLCSNGFTVEPEDIYLAPMYGGEIMDEALLARLRERRPRHIVITLGGGTQERLGYYLKRNLHFRPAIHCIGAAIAFLSGDQVRIPAWADRLYLGWLFRCISDFRFVSRYWSARKLLPLILHYRDHLPSVTSKT
jgi:N-acetylglucosaminyldiphosphoundecaprenol N-acetyl-beta-D-mannosaminyltransferase